LTFFAATMLVVALVGGLGGSEEARGYQSWDIAGIADGRDERYFTDAAKADDQPVVIDATEYSFISDKAKEAEEEARIALEKQTAASIRLDVPLVEQFPLAPTGCEIAALTMLLQYVGHDIDLETSLNTMWYSGDANQGFSGNPRNYSGWTIYPEPAGRWLAQMTGGYQNLTGASLEDLRDVLRAGQPIMIWYVHPRIGLHSSCITGFDADGFYINDPYGVKDWFCDYASFDVYWSRYNRMALTF
jgi:uncharacterized protein YvpB